MLGWFVETTLIAAGLTAGVLWLGRSRRLTAEAQHALWLVVLAKFLIPPVVSWPWTPLHHRMAIGPGGTTEAVVVPDPPRRPEPPRADLPRIATPGSDSGPPVPLPPERETAERLVVADPLGPSATVAPAVARGGPYGEPDPPNPKTPERWLDGPSRLGWRGVVVGAWGLGSIVVLTRTGMRIGRFGRTLRRAGVTPAWLGEEVASVAAQFGVRPPVVVVVSGLPSPLVWCLGRPRLVVPAGWDQLAAPARQALLAHELAHLARGDHRVVRLELIAGLVWWWNPAFRFARRRLRDAAEVAADARVVRAWPARRFAYAEALVAVCAHQARPAPPLPALGIGGPRAARTLEARLTMILRDPVRLPSRWTRLLAWSLLALAAPTWTLGQQDPAPSPKEPPQAELPPMPPREESPGPAVVSQPSPAPATTPARPSEKPHLEAAVAGLLDPAPLNVLRARRVTQVAALAHAEAIRDRADLEFKNCKKASATKTVSADEVALYKANLKIAGTAVDIEQGKLAEIDAQLNPSQAAPPHASTAVLQARRDAQAAEVARSEAEQQLARAVTSRNVALNKKSPVYVSPEEVESAQLKFDIAQAALNREKAKLLEADASLAQAKSGEASPRATGIGQPQRVTASGEMMVGSTLADYRDQVAWAELQLAGRTAEVNRATAKVDRVGKQLARITTLVQRNAASQEAAEAVEADYQQARGELGTADFAQREADLRLRQARQRQDAARTRLNREVERARSRLDGSRKLFRQGEITSRQLADDQDRLDDLMSQLDPQSKPVPEDATSLPPVPSSVQPN